MDPFQDLGAALSGFRHHEYRFQAVVRNFKDFCSLVDPINYQISGMSVNYLDEKNTLVIGFLGRTFNLVLTPTIVASKVAGDVRIYEEQHKPVALEHFQVVGGHICERGGSVMFPCSDFSEQQMLYILNILDKALQTPAPLR